MTKAVAIGLKIPDNTAFTAAVALRRLGIAVERVERSATAAVNAVLSGILRPMATAFVMMPAPGDRKSVV